MIDLPNDRLPTDNIWEAMYTQRAIRYWLDKKVPRDLLAKVIEAGSKAPSGANTQPWKFIVIDDYSKILAIAAALRGCYENDDALRNIIAEGEQSDDKTWRLMLRGGRAFFTELEKAPALIVPCLFGLSSPVSDPKSLLAGSSIYMAVQNILLAARALGLGTVMTTAQEMIDQSLREALNIPEEGYPVGLIPIGYPDANFGSTKRKGLSEVLSWNSWD
jgi:nitroreductase